MLGNVARQSEGVRLRPSQARLVLGLLLFAATWTFIPAAVGIVPLLPLVSRGVPLWLAVLDMVLTYFQPPNTGWLFFLPGLALALIFFGCFRAWLRRRPIGSGWLGPACAVSLALAVLENVLLLLVASGGDIASGWTRYTLGFVVSLTANLFISGVLSAYCWVEPPPRGVPDASAAGGQTSRGT